MFDWLFGLHITPQITPLVIHSLGGGHTHTHIHTHTHTHTHTRILTSRTKAILRNQARAGLRPARAWFKKIYLFYSIFANNYENTLFMTLHTMPGAASFLCPKMYVAHYRKFKIFKTKSIQIFLLFQQWLNDT